MRSHGNKDRQTQLASRPHIKQRTCRVWHGDNHEPMRRPLIWMQGHYKGYPWILVHKMCCKHLQATLIRGLKRTKRQSCTSCVGDEHTRQEKRNVAARGLGINTLQYLCQYGVFESTPSIEAISNKKATWARGLQGQEPGAECQHRQTSDVTFSHYSSGSQDDPLQECQHRL